MKIKDMIYSGPTLKSRKQKATCNDYNPLKKSAESAFFFLQPPVLDQLFQHRWWTFNTFAIFTSPKLEEEQRTNIADSYSSKWVVKKHCFSIDHDDSDTSPMSNHFFSNLSRFVTEDSRAVID